jgi:hypothetical protein
MALFLNAQGRAEFPVQILCLLMNRRAFKPLMLAVSVQRDAHDFMRLSFYFWSFAEITDIYFVWLDIKNDIKEL